MAEPGYPTPPENGSRDENNRLDRGPTRPGRLKSNTWGAAALIGAALLLGLWIILGGEEEERDHRPPRRHRRLTHWPRSECGFCSRGCAACNKSRINAGARKCWPSPALPP